MLGDIADSGGAANHARAGRGAELVDQVVPELERDPLVAGERAR